MSDVQDRQIFMQELGSILENYAEWYNNVLRSVYYTQDVGNPGMQRKPDSFVLWLGDAGDKGYIDDPLIQRLEDLDREFGDAAEKFYKKGIEAEQPTLQEFDDFRHAFENFYGRVLHVERDSELSDSGIDVETGMRSMTVYERDLSREIDRQARTNTQFCLAAVRIDGLESMTEEAQASELIKKAAAGILVCLRTFDDAYRQDVGTFILCLKNTDSHGATAALNRILRYFKSEEMYYETEEGQKPVSISGSITEVMPTDKPMELAANLSRDVKTNADQPGTILQFQELSELQRFVKGIGD